MGEHTSTFDPQRGVIPTLEVVPIEELSIDPSYQRSIENRASQKLIREIAQRWHWGLCQPLVVSARDEGASLFVIDGQHRLEAARLRGDIDALPCVLVECDGAEEKAASFVQLNQHRRPLSALELFRAAIASGEEEAIAIAQAITAAGLSIAPHLTSVAWKPGMVGNIGGIERAWRRHGPEVTVQALRILARAFDGEVIQYAGTIFPGIVAVCANGDAVGLVSLLRHRGQSQWRGLILRARADDPKLSFGRASALVLKRELDIANGRSPQPVTPAPPPPLAVPSQAAPQPFTFKPDRLVPDGKAWCDQCEMRVTKTEAETCKSRFCSLRKVSQ
jgi:hypothetical protein